MAPNSASDGTLVASEPVKSALLVAEAASVAARREADELRCQLSRERLAHEEMVQKLNTRRDSEVIELKQELMDVGAGLESREEEIFNIQFEMAAVRSEKDTYLHMLQDRHTDEEMGSDVQDDDEDTSQCFSEEVVPVSSEEIAAAHSEVDGSGSGLGSVDAEASREPASEPEPAQPDDSVRLLQKKIRCMSQELSESRVAYRTLRQHTHVVIARLERDREQLRDELDRMGCVSSCLQDVTSAEDREQPPHKADSLRTDGASQQASSVDEAPATEGRWSDSVVVECLSVDNAIQHRELLEVQAYNAVLLGGLHGGSGHLAVALSSLLADWGDKAFDLRRQGVTC